MTAEHVYPALLIAVFLCGCGDESGSLPPSGDTSTQAFAAASARRPTERYFLARTATRCEIFAENGDERTEPFATPCPEYMLVGERIRIAGKTCTLENKAQVEREKPVVCPDPLTHFEKRRRGLEK